MIKYNKKKSTVTIKKMDGVFHVALKLDHDKYSKTLMRVWSRAWPIVAFLFLRPHGV
jgi:hypothetical protein